MTAEQVNTWSLTGAGHDSSNALIAIRARCEREGYPVRCAVCDGHGSAEAYPGQRAAAEAWTATEPPEGGGWQLWETISEGSPISPVFATAAELATWMSRPDRDDRYARDWVPYPVAMQFVQRGWAPSVVDTPAAGVVSGVEAYGMAAQR